MNNNGLLVAGARGSITHRQSYGWHFFRSAPSLVNGALIDDAQNLWLAIEGLGVVVRPYLGNNLYGPDRWLLTDASVYRLVKNQHGVILRPPIKGCIALMIGKRQPWNCGMGAMSELTIFPSV